MLSDADTVTVCDIYSTVDPEGDLDGTASEAFEILRADRHGRSVHRRVDLFFHAPDDESFERGQPRSGQIERRAFTFGDPFDVAVERRLADNLYVFYRRNGRGGGTCMRRDGNRAARRPHRKQSEDRPKRLRPEGPKPYR